MNSLSATAVGLWVIFFMLAFGARSLIQLRRTGDSGFRLSHRSGTDARIASVLMTVGMLGGFAGAVVFVADQRAPSIGLDSASFRLAGLAVMVASIALTTKSQLDLRESWRIGVDERERTELVTTGIYACIRNPIFTGMLLFGVGGALASPTWLGAAAAAIAFVGFELQVRRVEEPYLAKFHKERYEAYAARAGRFVPFLGRRREIRVQRDVG